MSFILNPTNTGPTSSDVMIACTPRSPDAFEESMRTIRACGIELRKSFADRAAGICKSAAYCILPVTLSAPSNRGTGLPTFVYDIYAPTFNFDSEHELNLYFSKYLQGVFL